VTARRVDVLVAGGGPAGSVVAWTLARRGINVLLVGGREQNGDHDIAVTGAALAGLATLGSLDEAPLGTAKALQLGFGARPAAGAGAPPAWRTLADATGAVARNDRLRSWLRGAAVAAGTEFQAGTVLSMTDRPEGHEVAVGAEGATTPPPPPRPAYWPGMLCSPPVRRVSERSLNDTANTLMASRACNASTTPRRPHTSGCCSWLPPTGTRMRGQRASGSSHGPRATAPSAPCRP
jgi:hypothetical protein